MIFDELIEQIIRKQNPACVGLDPAPECLGFCGEEGEIGEDEWAARVTKFNRCVIGHVHDVVPAVKVQIAYYEAHGAAGIGCFEATCACAKEHGLTVIADCKRNDIGSTAQQYADGYFGGSRLRGGASVDLLTVNGYLGTDGVAPFIEKAKERDRGIFVLVKTSNPSSGELQDQRLADGRTVYECMGDMVEKWGEGSRGAYGYSRVGAVVGATYPEEAKILRERMPHSFFLIPGYGAQGASAEMLKHCFKSGGMGGIVNSSRAIMGAWRKSSLREGDVETKAMCARGAALKMKEDLLSVLGEIHA